MIIWGSLQSTRKTAELGGRRNSEYSVRHGSKWNTEGMVNAFRSILDLVLSYENMWYAESFTLYNFHFIYTNLKLLESNWENATEVLR